MWFGDLVELVALSSIILSESTVVFIDIVVCLLFVVTCYKLGLSSL